MKAKAALFCCGQQAGIAICGVWRDMHVDVALVSQSCRACNKMQQLHQLDATQPH
jgi:hypothetical protein